MRAAIFAVTLVFLGAFLAATIAAAVDRGFTVLSVVSLLIIVLLGIGIIGSMLHDPGGDD